MITTFFRDGYIIRFQCSRWFYFLTGYLFTASLERAIDNRAERSVARHIGGVVVHLAFSVMVGVMVELLCQMALMKRLVFESGAPSFYFYFLQVMIYYRCFMRRGALYPCGYVITTKQWSNVNATLLDISRK